MVGWLVENQQVHRFQQQPYHSQSATLATAEHLHQFVRGLAAKHKGTKNIVETQADITTRHAVDSLKYRKTLVKQLCLILGKIAYLHIMAYLQIAFKGNLAHDTLHQR